MNSELDTSLGDYFSTIIGDAVSHILAHEDPQAFLEWFMQRVLEHFADPDMRPLASTMGRAIWNATPLPGNGFQSRPLPAPGRNDPCPCGSGSKFKRCCGAGPPMPDMDPLMFWPVVLQQLPKADRNTAIAEGQVPTDVLIGAAIEAREAGRPKAALDFLEPLFKQKFARTGEDAEYALDLVCDLYDVLRYTSKKPQLLKRVAREAKRSPLRSGALQRLAAISMDSGDLKSAWSYFQAAQRDDPDSTSLSMLEIQLLMGEGKTTLASERARYWVKRLQRQGYPDDEQPLPFLKSIVADAELGMAQIGIDIAGGAGQRLLQWLGEVAERDVPDYGVIEGPDETRFLVPPESVVSLEDDWHETFLADKPFSVHMSNGDATVWEPENEDAWMHFLESNANAFDSLDILDDLAGAVLNHERWEIPGIDQKLMEPVLERAKSIIDKALNDLRDVRLVWMFPENRPPLRCLVHLVFLQQRYGFDDAAEALAAKVLSLNPHDNHGLRSMVINACLRRGDNESALALAEQYPADLSPDIGYGKALALFRLQLHEAADEALREAISGLPKVPRFLAAKRIRKPKLDAYGTMIGGDDQAWLYRDEMRDVWSATPGALEW